MKFKIGDQVIHCRDGLAKISSITEIDGREFFLVVCQRQGNETIYVPLDKADIIIRHLMNKEQADEIIDFMNTVTLEFNKNTKQRRDLFKKKLSSGDVHELAYLFRQYQLCRAHPDEVKLGPVDVDMLSYATNNLLDEFAITYDIPRNKIEEHIYSRLK